MIIQYRKIKVLAIEDLEKELHSGKQENVSYVSWIFLCCGDMGAFSQKYAGIIEKEISEWNNIQNESDKSPKNNSRIQLIFADIGDMKEMPFQISAIPAWYFVYMPDSTPEENPMNDTKLKIMDAGSGYYTLQAIIDMFSQLQSNLQKQLILNQHVIEITDPKTGNVFLKEHPTNILYFWNEDCSVCHTQWNLLVEVSSILFACFPDLIIGKIDTNQAPTIAQGYKVDAIPTWIIYTDNQLKEKHVGGLDLIPLYEWLAKFIKPAKDIQDFMPKESPIQAEQQ